MKLKMVMVALGLAFALGARDAYPALGNNELFLEVWNGDTGAGGKSYIKDLGITLDAFMNAPGCFNYVVQDLSRDTNLASLAGTDGALPPATVWNVQALNNDNPGSLSSSIVDAAGNDPQSPKNHSGFLATASNPDDLLDLVNTYPAFGPVAQNMSNHFLQASAGGFDDSKSFSLTDSGFYLGPSADSTWGEDMGGGAVGFFRNQQIGTANAMFFLTVDSSDYSTGLVGNSGLPLGEWSFDGKQLSFKSSDTTPPPTCPVTTQCGQLSWKTLASGQSVIAYKDSTSNDCEAAANKETRNCLNGQLSGGFTQQSCSGPVACPLPWGGTIPNGQSVTAYKAGASAACEAVENKETRTCDNGTLRGTFQNQSCAPAACSLPWGGQIASGQGVAAYAADKSANCDAAKEIRTCDNGNLSGGNSFQSCANQASCDLPWGGKLDSGQSIDAYPNDKSPYCGEEKEIRTCDNGKLSGLYTHASCSVSEYGPYIRMLVPNGSETWNARTPQTVQWTTVNIDPKERLNLYFSRDGGKQWLVAKKGLKNTGRVTWKPGKSRLTQQGLLAICLPQTNTRLAKCDKSNAVFAIAK